MIKREELEQLYNKDLKEKLSGLEGMRKKLLLHRLAGIAGIIVPFIIFIATLSATSTLNNSALFLPIVLAAIIIFSIVILILSIKKKRLYRKAYKSEVVTKIVHAIDPNWNYVPDQSISTAEYLESDLFRTHYDKYEGDDFISGVIDKTDFRCSELHTQYKSVSTDHDGKRQDKWVTIFKGLFFHADFNKHFTGKTYIAPDVAERVLGNLGKKLQKITGKADLVKLENPEFEKYFVVHATDQIEARYILTPTIMEALVKIYKEYKRPIHLSFIGSRVYCAISFTRDLFEPKIMRSGVKFEDMENMYDLFMVNATIIKELNLNTRIWTKD
ncbi:MAG: hypothetical protein CVU00_15345 [Bacteroidetes bacterium HGW-Bacteroidetes-17]|jgi:hypothetical protein|nr:MAG: hypothetical protein CVU00_15345 [Bacteroidetes bacterium HGW-Bacteroidetes-17]